MRWCWRVRNLLVNILPGHLQETWVGFDGLNFPWEVHISWPLLSDGASFVLGGGGLPNQSSCFTCCSHHPRKASRHKFETCFASLLALCEFFLSLIVCFVMLQLLLWGIWVGLRISQFLWCILTGYTFWYLLWWSQGREFCVRFLIIT